MIFWIPLLLAPPFPIIGNLFLNSLKPETAPSNLAKQNKKTFTFLGFFIWFFFFQTVLAIMEFSM